MIPYYSREGIVILHGDCRDVLPTLEQVDHVITDPPYRRDLYLSYRTNKGALNDRVHVESDNHLALANGSIGALEDVIEVTAVELQRLARRWQVVFHDAESGHLWRDAMGSAYVRTGVWVKINSVPQISGDRPGQGFELATIGHAPGKKRWNGGGRVAVWRHNTSRGLERPDHPCPKPLPLMLELVRLFTDPGDVILDPFAGSGTTGIAAFQLHRKAILIELEEKWCEVAAKRLEAETPPLPLYEAEQSSQEVLAL